MLLEHKGNIHTFTTTGEPNMAVRITETEDNERECPTEASNAGESESRAAGAYTAPKMHETDMDSPNTAIDNLIQRDIMSDDKRDLNLHVSGKMDTVKEDGIKDDNGVMNDSANFKKRKIIRPPKRRRHAEAHWRGKKTQGWNGQQQQQLQVQPEKYSQQQFRQHFQQPPQKYPQQQFKQHPQCW
jgi:hypothetical protein